MRKSLIRLMALLLVVVPFLGVWANESSAASTRVAVIKELKGTVKVKKAGGSKEFTAFAKMSLNEGDVLAVGSGGSALLQFANGTSEDDKMTVGANTKLSFSKLSNKKGTTTKVSMWSGSAWVDVKSITNKDDQFTLETPTAVMGVRGTHFMTTVNPLTGTTQLNVAGGIVSMTPPVPNGAVPPPPQLIYPSQSILTLPSGTGLPTIDPAPIDPSTLVTQAGPALIEAMLRASVEIQQENARLMSQYITDLAVQQSDLQRTQNNIDNLVSVITNQAIKASIIQQSAINKIQEELLRLTGQQIDLSVQELQLSIEERRKQELQREAEKRAKEEADRRKQEEASARNKELLEKIKQKQEEQKKAAEEAIKKKKDKAFSDYESQLDEAGKKRLKEARDNLPQNQVPSPSVIIPGGNNPGGSNSAPTSLSLSETVVAENAAIGTTIGTFSAVDPNSGDTFTYSLVSGAGDTDNASFTIEGTTLKTAVELNDAARESYSIRVRVTDAGGLYTEQHFTITVTDAGYVNPLQYLKVSYYEYEGGGSSSPSVPIDFEVPLDSYEYEHEIPMKDKIVIELETIERFAAGDVKITINGVPKNYYQVYDRTFDLSRTRNEIVIEVKPHEELATDHNTERFTLYVTRQEMPEGISVTSTTYTSPSVPGPIIDWDIVNIYEYRANITEAVESITLHPIVNVDGVEVPIEGWLDCTSANCEEGMTNGLTASNLVAGEVYEFNLYLEHDEINYLKFKLVNDVEEPDWNEFFYEGLEFREDHGEGLPISFHEQSGEYYADVPFDVEQLDIDFVAESEYGYFLDGIWDERTWTYLSEGWNDSLKIGDNGFKLFLEYGNDLYTHGYDLNIRKYDPHRLFGWIYGTNNGSLYAQYIGDRTWVVHAPLFENEIEFGTLYDELTITGLSADGQIQLGEVETEEGSVLKATYMNSSGEYLLNVNVINIEEPDITYSPYKLIIYNGLNIDWSEYKVAGISYEDEDDLYAHVLEDVTITNDSVGLNKEIVGVFDRLGNRVPISTEGTYFLDSSLYGYYYVVVRDTISNYLVTTIIDQQYYY